MCTGRLDLSHVLRAFAKGSDGVFIAGCHLNECNYTTHGNYHALSMVHLCKRLIEQIGLNPERLRMELISSGEGNRFAEIMNDFGRTVAQLGALGSGEEMGGKELGPQLQMLTRLVPYIKLVKGEKLRTRLQDAEEYSHLFTSDEVEQLLLEVISYYIDPDRCQACMTCAKRCPVDAIEGGKNLVHVINQEKCIKCGTCIEACPPRFDAVTKIPCDRVPPPIPKETRTIARTRKD